MIKEESTSCWLLAYWRIAISTYTFFDDIQQALSHIQGVSGSLNAIEFWVEKLVGSSDGEFPTLNLSEADVDLVQEDSTTAPLRQAMKNAQTYFDDAVCGMISWGVNVFVFEAMSLLEASIYR